VHVLSKGEIGLQVESLRKILGNSKLRSLAIETGFSKRSSFKLSAEVFFDLMFYASSLSANSSLEYLVSYLESHYDIQIRKQSLDDRFTERTVSFVQSVLKQLISEQFSEFLLCQEFLKDFHHVRIKDSTTFKVPSNLAANYTGTHGHLAGITIQYEFDLKTGQFLDLTITQASRNDQTDASQTAGNVCKNDLIIRDLGYFSISVLKKINEKEAFFLSRLQAATGVYDENGVEIDFKNLYAFMSERGIDKCEKQVLIGNDKLPVRLTVGLVPPQVYEERIRSKQKEEKKRGYQMKERTKFLCHFNLFVTNVDSEKLPVEKIMSLYRFRWQIELMFKNWKSVFSVHGLQKMKENRYITMLYIRLILVIVNLQIINRAQNLLSKQGKRESILSYQKALQTLKNSFFEILGILRCSMEKAIKLLGGIYHILSKYHWRERRQKRENYVDNIWLFGYISEK